MQKSYFYLFVALITIGAGFFASTSPDGLDFVSEKLNFAHKGLSGHSLMSGYAVPILGDGVLSTIAAGILGVVILSALFAVLKQLAALHKTK